MMSMPNIPNVDAEISIDKENSMHLLLASIAFEELAQAHLINAEAEKIQYALGTLGDSKPSVPTTLTELLDINQSASQMLKYVIKNQMLLLFKLEDILAHSDLNIYKNTAVVTAFFREEALSESDIAYYHTKGAVLV